MFVHTDALVVLAWHKLLAVRLIICQLWCTENGHFLLSSLIPTQPLASLRLAGTYGRLAYHSVSFTGNISMPVTSIIFCVLLLGTLIYSSSPAMCPRVHVCVGATLAEHLHVPCGGCTTVWACTTAGTPPSIIGVLPQSGGGGGGMVDKEQIYQWIQDLSSSESYTREQALMELRWAEMGPSTPDVLQDTVTGIVLFVVIR